MLSSVISRRFIVLATLLTATPLLAEKAVSGRILHAVDGGAMEVEFNVRPTGNGGGAGTLRFQSPVNLPDTDEDDRFGPKGRASLTMKVDVDCLVVSGSRASMSGVVREATVAGYGGRRLLLAVEDGETTSSDKFTWGVSQNPQVQWFPADAELEFDDGAGRSWIARDAERDDDKGVAVESRRHRVSTDCHTFGLAAHDLIAVPSGGGDIVVGR